MKFLHTAARWALAATVVLALPSVATNNTYDYIVVGSGPGGGPLASTLSRNGYSVLLIEAGDDESASIDTQVPAFAFTETGDNALHWDFFVRHYSSLERTLKHHYLTWRLPDGEYWVGQNPPAGAVLLGVYYPRGATLGGSAVINYLVNFLPQNSYWQDIMDLTGDQAWSNMRKIFERVERCHYVPNGTAGHGFNGFIDTINGVGSGNEYRDNIGVVTVLKAMLSQLGLDPNKLYQYLFGDINNSQPNRDSTDSFYGISYTANPAWRRVTGRDLILSTANAKKQDGTAMYPLTLQLNTLATKILFTQGKGQPRAFGVEYLQGKSAYSADPRHDPGAKGTAGTAYARKEVIISGGAFNSPQLLKLSGIGPKAELAQFKIPLVANLPGVGYNMMDNPEVPIVGLAKQDFVSTDNSSAACTFGAPGDPCLAEWEQGTGPYADGSTNVNALLRRSAHAVNSDWDMFMFSGNFAFRGFWPFTNQSFVDPPNTFGMSTVKMHNQNRAGTVLLRSADPTDTPLINFNLFTDGADTDLGAILDTIKFGRRAFLQTPAPFGPVNASEPPCSSPPAADGSCSDVVDREWVLDQAFGHHATSTCAIGSVSDPMAVLDSRFRVRGVHGLRVVDASAHPRSPGAFPVMPTYMLSVQASDFILKDANSWN
ncbi:GMC oxidoreductase-like protein [Thozetella sp. PMI_491]|nr:GMC oxidoreductase-like protein [Thozetella sp. PMI_491]